MLGFSSAAGGTIMAAARAGAAALAGMDTAFLALAGMTLLALVGCVAGRAIEQVTGTVLPLALPPSLLGEGGSLLGDGMPLLRNRRGNAVVSFAGQVCRGR